jgi:hypothetical protein
MDEGLCNDCGFEGDWNSFLDEKEKRLAEWATCPKCGSTNTEMIENEDPADG